MFKKIAGVVIGIIVGAIAIGICEGLSHLIYEPPSQMDIQNTAAMAKFIEQAPPMALILVALCHFVGSFTSAFVSQKISKSENLSLHLIPSVLLMIGGIVNFYIIPHPLWMIILDLIVYIPAGYLGVQIGKRNIVL